VRIEHDQDLEAEMNCKVMFTFLLIAIVLVISWQAQAEPVQTHETSDIEHLGSVVFPGDFYDVLYHNSYLYLADGRQSHSGNLKVLDVSVPENPQVVASDAFPRCTVYSLDAQGDLLAAAVHGYGMVLYDISNPMDIQQISEMQTEDLINDIVFDGDLLYVMEPGYTIILDISDPANPAVVSETTISGSNYEGAVSDNGILAIPGGTHLRFFDVSNPESPVEMLDYTEQQMMFHAVIAHGSLFYVGMHSTFINSGGIKVFDASDPENIQLVAGRTAFGADVPPHVGLSIDGNALFYTAGQTGLVTYDITDPLSPTQVSQLGEGMPWPPDVGSWQTRVAAGDGYAFTILPDRQDWNTYNNLWVLDNSDISDPVLVGEYDTPDFTTHVAGTGNFAFVGAEHDGVYAIDISDPALLEVVGNISFSLFTFPARQMLYEDGLLYTNGGGMALAIINVSDPGLMQVVTEINTGMHRYTGLDKQDDLVAITGWDANPMPPGWIELWDVVNPANPQPTGYFELGMRTEAVALHGNFAYVAWDDGLGVVAIENPAEPFIINQYDTGILALDVLINDDVLWFSDDQANLYTMDITQPIAPVLITSTILPDDAVDLSVAGDSLYIATRSEVFVANVSDPADPALVDTVPIEGNTQGIAIVDDKLLLSDRYGFHVYATGMTGVFNGGSVASIPDDFSISAYPNPFNATTRIDVFLPQSQQLTLEVFNLMGQRVAQLVNTRMPAGRHSFTLDGKDLTSGVYVVRNRASGYLDETHKIVLIK